MPPDTLPDLAARFRGRRLLVTGAAGCIGANLVRSLLEAGCAVDAVLRPGSRAWRLAGLAGALTRHEADVGDDEQIERVFAAVRPEVVFHLAVPRGHDERARAEMLRVNVLGAHALIQCVQRYGMPRLVVAGSSLEYAPSPTALSEQSPVAPLTWHGATKAAASVLYRQAFEAHGLPVVLLRLFHVFGPWESAHRLAPTAVRAALHGLAMPLTEGEIRRDWVFVEDVCEALLLAADKAAAGDVFNIGSGVETSNQALVDAVASTLGRTIRVSRGEVAPRVTDVPHRLADRSWAQRRLGWVPRHSLDDGLRRTVAWYVKHPAAWSEPADMRPEVV
jgi:nucleoside-diphosphate-sugar epimerase